MRSWWVVEISRCQRCSAGKTGCGRGSCQLSLICQAKKPKLHACNGMQSCGGVLTQTTPFRAGVFDSLFFHEEGRYPPPILLLSDNNWEQQQSSHLVNPAQFW